MFGYRRIIVKLNHVFRFNQDSDPSGPGHRSRLQKKRLRTTSRPFPLGADPESISGHSGLRPIDTYQEGQHENAVTLTQREADLVSLMNPGVEPPKALETLHPWLPPQKYLGHAERSYKQLVAVLRRYGKHMFAPDDFCNRGWNTLCNTLRMTSTLDARFYGAWHLPLQDAYVLEERRPNRSVIAIDFNAMYAACMQHPFPAPGRMKRVRYNRLLKEDETLPAGLFRCKLTGDTSAFIRKHNPFRSFFSGRYLGTRLTNGIEADLNEFEVVFYRRHFSYIHIVDAILSDRIVAHPLAREARRTHARRMNYKGQSNKALADREKFRMTLMASCTNRPHKEHRLFPDRPSALAHLQTQYGIRSYPGEPEAAMDTWLAGKKGISVYRHLDGVKVKAPALQEASACFSMNQRIIARGRTVLLEQMEKLVMLFPELEICYCNIDSIHFSIPKIHLADVMMELQAEASEEMGGFKIEAVTNHGLWLEPGRYWLYSDSVEKFSNLGVSDGIHPFNERKIYTTARKIGGLHIPMRVGIDMAGSMSDAKAAVREDTSGLTRLHPVEIVEGMRYDAVLSELGKNRRETIPVKLEAFRCLKQRVSPRDPK